VVERPQPALASVATTANALTARMKPLRMRTFRLIPRHGAA
jgi:hypothetical protein